VNQKTLLTLCCVASIGIALLVVFNNKADKDAIALTENKRMPVQLESANKKAPILSTTKEASDTYSASLSQQMLLTTSVRAFVEQAKQQPEKGGIYLAETALMNCKQALWLTDQKDHAKVIQMRLKSNPELEMNVPKALAAANHLSARCQGFSAEDYAKLELYSGKLGDGRAVDPLIEATKKIRDLHQSGKEPTFTESLEYAALFAKLNAFEASDGIGAFSVLDPKSKKNIVYFDGKPWGGYNDDSFKGAQKALFLSTAMSDQNSIHWLSNCAYNLNCKSLNSQEDVINEVIQDPYFAKSKVNKEVLKREIAELMPKLKQATNTNNFNAFTPPNKPAG
jgi:hypothetical protein